jgi:2,3-bisphosphoglycerate-independent phosphoglycerate mutase
VENSYESGVTDEFVRPINCAPNCRIEHCDSVIFYNFRPDRARELTRALCDDAFDGFVRPGGAVKPHFVCFTQYDAAMPNVQVAFKPQTLKNIFGEYIAEQGLTQLRIAETEKYAHVTFFLNGGREAEFAGESRILIPSPKVATYDLQPEMSAPEVAKALVAELKKQEFDFIALNFANGDMVGHTGVWDAIYKAVKTVDGCVKDVVTTAVENGYEVVIIADHGNADNAMNEDGSPNTAHSLNPVPIIVVSERVKSVENGVLADVAPTVLKLMGVAQPAEMNGKALVEFK